MYSSYCTNSLLIVKKSFFIIRGKALPTSLINVSHERIRMCESRINQRNSLRQRLTQIALIRELNSLSEPNVFRQWEIMDIAVDYLLSSDLIAPLQSAFLLSSQDV